MKFRFGFVVAVLAIGGCGGVVIEDPVDADEQGPAGAGGNGAGGAGGAPAEPPDNEPPGTCDSPLDIDLSDGSVTISGDTSTVADEHPDLTCDSPHVAFTFDQGQLYYQFQAQLGRTYSFSLTPSFYGFLYVFPTDAGCSESAIQEACASGGETGMVSPIVNPGTTGMAVFVAPASTSYIVAVDGDTSGGPFELVITPD